MKTFLVSFFLTISLTACASVPPKPSYIPIPSELLADCSKSVITGKTVADLALAYNARGVDIDKCTADKRSLREWDAKLKASIK